MDAITFTTFVRKPFSVEATEITNENIEELAELIGKLKHKENGDPYILVNRNVVPNVLKVYPGYFVTKMNDNIRCYSKKIFNDQFVENNDDIEKWIEFLNQEVEKDV